MLTNFHVALQALQVIFGASLRLLSAFLRLLHLYYQAHALAEKHPDGRDLPIVFGKMFLGCQVSSLRFRALHMR